jgi:hypothetical protein
LTLESEAGGSQQPPDIDRRTALKRGAIVGGVVLWSTPIVTAIGVRAADAASAPPPLPPPPPPLPPTATGLPSHGFFLLLCEGKYLGYQIIGAQSDLKRGSVMSPEHVGSPGQGNNVPYWQANGYAAVPIIVSDGEDPKWKTTRAQISAGVTTLNGAQVLVLNSYPASCSLLNAYIWDGSFQKDPDGDKVRAAYFIDGKYYFYV